MGLPHGIDVKLSLGFESNPGNDEGSKHYRYNNGGQISLVLLIVVVIGCLVPSLHQLICACLGLIEN